ncbi:MAG: hypothetical protein E6G45_03980 [Actinobacteria bacterium]|nr:MAG: hypothetical protein E6G45_03980 [Actinomycetota bacterium]
MARKRKLEEPALRNPAAIYLDAEGNRTEDPALAVRGEVVEHDEKDGRTRRTWFFIEEVEIKWLPISESAFLLWVLGLLLGIWLLIGVIFGLI